MSDLPTCDAEKKTTRLCKIVVYGVDGNGRRLYCCGHEQRNTDRHRRNPKPKVPEPTLQQHRQYRPNGERLGLQQRPHPLHPSRRRRAGRMSSTVCTACGIRSCVGGRCHQCMPAAPAVTLADVMRLRERAVGVNAELVALCDALLLSQAALQWTLSIKVDTERVGTAQDAAMAALLGATRTKGSP